MHMTSGVGLSIRQNVEMLVRQFHKYGISIAIEKIGPKTAKEYLKKNIDNRNLRTSHSEKLAAAIRALEWGLNGETIKFNRNGVLIDGQHRLNAVIVSGKPIVAIVVRGIDPNLFHTIDQGKPRNLRDILVVEKIKNPGHMAMAIPILIKLEGGFLLRGSHGWTNQFESLEFLDKNKELHKAVKFCKESGASKIGSIGMVAAMLYQMERIDFDLAREFVSGVITGEMLKKTDPRFILRERLVEGRHDHTKKLGQNQVVFCWRECWRMYVTKQQMRKITIPKKIKELPKLKKV